MDKYKVEMLRTNLEKMVVYGNRRYQEIWRHSYPLVRDAYKKNSLSSDDMDELNGLKEIVMYIDIPFCTGCCSYCRYYRSGINKISTSEYVDCLIDELKNLLRTGEKKILSILIGGGTPNLLKPNDLRKLLNFINSNFKSDKSLEITMEATPYNLSKEMAEAIVESGVKRVSIGVQTFNEAVLDKTHRPQKNEDVYRAVGYLQEAGVENINFDMIYRLNRDDDFDVFLRDNLKHIKSLAPSSVEIFPLQSYKKYPEDIYEHPIDELENIVKQINREMGESIACEMIPIIHSADEYKKVFQARHSSYLYLRRVPLMPVIGVGTGANSNIWLENTFLLRRYRYSETEKYIESIKKGEVSYDYYSLDKDRIFRRFLVATLSLGIDIEIAQKKFKQAAGFIDYLVTELSDFIIKDGNILFLRKDFSDSLPFSVNNDNVNYFIFSYLYIYTDEDRELMLKAIK